MLELRARRAGARRRRPDRAASCSSARSICRPRRRPTSGARAPPGSPRRAWGLREADAGRSRRCWAGSAGGAGRARRWSSGAPDARRGAGRAPLGAHDRRRRGAAAARGAPAPARAARRRAPRRRRDARRARVRALAEARAPLWVCALGRPEFVDEHPSWGERAGQREAHRLGPLDPRERGRPLPAPAPPGRGRARLRRRAPRRSRRAPCPLLLVELVRGLRREGLVRRQPQGRRAATWRRDELDRLPDLPLVEWLAHGEVEGSRARAPRPRAPRSRCSGDEVTIADVEGVLRRLEEHGGGVEFPLDAKIGDAAAARRGHPDRGPGGADRLPARAGARGDRPRQIPEPMRRRIHLAAALHHRDAEPRGGEAGRRGAPLSRRRRSPRRGLAHSPTTRRGGALRARGVRVPRARRAMRARHAYVEAERSTAAPWSSSASTRRRRACTAAAA